MTLLPDDPRERAETTTSVAVGAGLLVVAFVFPSAVSHVLARTQPTLNWWYVIQGVPPALFALAVALRARAVWRALVAVALTFVYYLVIVEPLWMVTHGHYGATPRPVSYLLWIVQATCVVAAWGVARRPGWFWLVGLLAAWPISWLDSRLIRAVSPSQFGVGEWTNGALSALAMLGILAGIFVCYLTELVGRPDPAHSNPDVARVGAK